MRYFLSITYSSIILTNMVMHGPVWTMVTSFRLELLVTERITITRTNLHPSWHPSNLSYIPDVVQLQCTNGNWRFVLVTPGTQEGAGSNPIRTGSIDSSQDFSSISLLRISRGI
uniref:Uncharacterized protein n=1 Tax=Cacopsylla melanoneura TaxID=428564 RepID=A0A8D8WVU6_9HEMI